MDKPKNSAKLNMLSVSKINMFPAKLSLWERKSIIFAEYNLSSFTNITGFAASLEVSFWRNFDNEIQMSDVILIERIISINKNRTE